MRCRQPRRACLPLRARVSPPRQVRKVGKIGLAFATTWFMNRGCEALKAVFATAFCALQIHMQGAQPTNPPSVQWQLATGVHDNRITRITQRPNDLGYYVGGTGSGNFWFKRYDINTNILMSYVNWGGPGADHLVDLKYTPDGRLMAAVNSDWGPAGTNTNRGGYDFHLLCLTQQAGDVVWERRYGTTGNDYLNGFCLCPLDGGFYLAGSTWGVGGDRSAPSFGSQDFWVIRLDNQGNKLWDKSLGGSDFEGFVYGVSATPDGGCVIGGESFSGISGNKTVQFGGNPDHFWILRLSAEGEIVWQSGATNGAYIGWLTATSDGGAVAALDGKWPPPCSFGRRDYQVVRFGPGGRLLWEHCFGGSGDDWVAGIQQTFDGGFIVCGHSDSPPSGNKTSPNFGGVDCWVVRLDANGDKLWDATYGTIAVEESCSILQTKDGGFLLGAVVAPRWDEGRGQAWLVKLSPDMIQLRRRIPEYRSILTTNFAFWLLGPSNTYVVDYSTNGYDWFSLQTNSVTNAPVAVEDPSPRGNMRIYRARSF